MYLQRMCTCTVTQYKFNMCVVLKFELSDTMEDKSKVQNKWLIVQVYSELQI